MGQSAVYLFKYITQKAAYLWSLAEFTRVYPNSTDTENVKYHHTIIEKLFIAGSG